MIEYYVQNVLYTYYVLRQEQNVHGKLTGKAELSSVEKIT